MCGRFVSITDADGLARFLVVDQRVADDLGERYNVAPTQPVYAAVEHEGSRHLVTFRWGLVPGWAKDPGVGNRMINARSETVADKPAFKSSLRRRRCLVPADGFYEWQRRADGKLPHYVRRVDGDPLAFAGLWAVWSDPDDPDAEPLRTCAILTCEANDDMRPLHDRMPLSLEPDAWDAWLDRDLEDPEALADLLRPPDPGLLTAHPVSTEVNSPRNDHPGLLEPA